MIVPFAGIFYASSRLEMESLESLRDHLTSWTLPGLIGGSVLLWLSERWSRKNRGPFIIGVADSVLLGFGQLFSWIPGVGGILGMISVSQFRNYHLEAATKIACLMSLPFVCYEALHGIHSIQWASSEPLPAVSWFHWGFSVTISTIGAIAALKILNEQLVRSGFGKVIAYRLLIAMAMAGLQIWG